MGMATGVRDTTNLTARKYDVKDVISLLDVGEYPMLAILTNAGKDPASKQGKALKKMETTDSEFKWYEDEFGSREATTATGQTGKNIASTPGVSVASGQGARFAVGDIIQFVAAKYTFEVTAVSTDALTLSDELGGATGTVDLSSLTVWIIGNANAEGGTLREIKGTTPVEKVGYTQIFRTPFGTTETSANTDTLIKENDLDFQRRKKGIEHMVDIERAFWFGKKSKRTGTNGKPIRTTAGVIDVITTYATANVDTEAEFETWLEDVFRYGNKEKYAFCSPQIITMINGFAKAKVELVQSEKTYGITILKYVSAHGTLNLIKHNLFTGTPYGNYAVALDMEAATYRYLKNRDSKLLTNRQANDADEKIEEYLTETGLQLEQEKRHAICSYAAL